MDTSIDNVIPVWPPTPSPDSTELEIDYSSWKRPPGLIGDIADFIYFASPSPLIEVAIGAALAFFAGIVGRAYNVRGMGLNLYVIALAPSGAGKNGGKIGIERLYEHLQPILVDTAKTSLLTNPLEIRKGIGFLTSPQGLRNSIAGAKGETPKMCSLSVLGEFGIQLQELCMAKSSNANLKGLFKLILDLYTSSGGATTIGRTVYSDGDKNIAELVAPAWSIFGDSTQMNFFRAVSEDSIASGLLPRFSPIEFPVGVNYPETNFAAAEAKPSMALLNALAGIMRRVAEVEHTADMLKLYKWIDVPFDADAYRFDVDLAKEMRLKMQSLSAGPDAYLSELWSRFREKLLRVAGLLAVGVNPDNPVITLDEMVWAKRLTLHGTELMIARFESGKVGEPVVHIQQHDALYSLLLDFYKASSAGQWKASYETSYSINQAMFASRVVNYKYIQNKLHKRPAFSKAANTPMALKNIIKDFNDSRYLLRVPPDAKDFSYHRGEMWQIQPSILHKT